MTKNITLGKLEVGDFVWIRVNSGYPFLYYGIEWEKGDTAYIGSMEDIGGYLEIAKVNGLWFYVYRAWNYSTERGRYPGDVVNRFEVYPYARVSLTLSTENGRVIDSKTAYWNYSTVEVLGNSGLEIKYKVDRDLPIGINYIVLFEGYSKLPFGASIEVEVYSFLLHDYAWLPLTMGLALLVASIFSNRAQRRRRPSAASQGSLENKRLCANGDR